MCACNLFLPTDTLTGKPGVIQKNTVKALELIKGHELLPELWDEKAVFILADFSASTMLLWQNKQSLCSPTAAPVHFTVHMFLHLPCLFLGDLCVVYYCRFQKKGFALARVKNWIIEQFQGMEPVIKYTAYIHVVCVAVFVLVSQLQFPSLQLQSGCLHRLIWECQCNSVYKCKTVMGPVFPTLAKITFI